MSWRRVMAGSGGFGSQTGRRGRFSRRRRDAARPFGDERREVGTVWDGPKGRRWLKCAMPDTQLALLQRYLPWRRYVEVGYWVVAMLLGATINTVVAWFDVQRAHLDFALWQPAVWEWSSCLAMLALLPVLLAFDRRFPIE